MLKNVTRPLLEAMTREEAVETAEFFRLRIWGSGVRIFSGAPIRPQNQCVTAIIDRPLNTLVSVPGACPENSSAWATASRPSSARAQVLRRSRCGD